MFLAASPILGLDIPAAFFRIRELTASSMPGCEHNRTEFLMRRDGVEYVRCLECDAVFEADDLEQIPVYDDEDELPSKTG